MPVIDDKQYICDTRVVTWLNGESTEELDDLCRVAGISYTIEGCEKNRREMMAELLLLRYAFHSEVELLHTTEGAPYLAGGEAFVSFSHSGKYVVLAVNRDLPVGVDIEFAADKAMRVRRKFVNETEAEYLPPDDGIGHLVAWTAKEALFKVIPESLIDFTKHLHLDLSSGRELYTAYETRSDRQRHYLMQSTAVYDNFVLTLAVLCPDSDYSDNK